MKNSTYLCFFSLVLGVLLFGSIHAQTVVTVPGNYANVQQAIVGVFGNAAISNAIIQVGEGIFNAPSDNTIATWPDRKLSLTIQGAGADKTFQRPDNALLTERIAVDGGRGARWLQIAGTATENNKGSSLTIKDMTYQYFGSFSSNISVGACLNIAVANDVEELDIRFENVVFDNIVGPAVVNVPKGQASLTIENCLFKECVATFRDKGNIIGLVRKQGTLFIRNTTFYSCEFQVQDSVHNGNIIYAQASIDYPASDVVLENNAFVNNRWVSNKPGDELTLRNPIITIEGDTLATNNLTMVNNIMVGNGRSGVAKDFDLYIAGPEFINWVASSGNILTSAFTRPVEPDGEYVPLPLQGSKIDPTYTYTDPRINFTMDGDLPALTADDKAIGGVSYSGDGGEVVHVRFDNVKDSQFKAYIFDNTLYVKGVQSGKMIEVYTITGSVFNRSLTTSDVFEMTIPKGLYIIRYQNRRQKVLVQ